MYRPFWFRETLRYTLQGIALFPVFVTAVRWHDRSLFRPLNWRWVQRIGVLSYSFYLTHYTIFAALQQWLPRAGMLVQGILALAASLAASELIFRLIEKPCGMLRRRLTAPASPHANGLKPVLKPASA